MESLKNLWNTIWGLKKQEPFPKKQPKKKVAKKRGRPKKK